MPPSTKAGSPDATLTVLTLAGPVVFLTVVGACYGFVLPFGPTGHAAGALVGGVWGFLLARGLGRMSPTFPQGPSPDLLFALTLACVAAVLAGGWLYNRMFVAVLGSAEVSGEILSAMMAPPVPFFIVLNSPLELLLFPALLILSARKSALAVLPVLIAAAAYLAMRVWTYAVFAAPRVDMTAAPLSPADIAEFERLLSTDYRTYLLAAALVALLWSAWRHGNANASALSA